MLRDKERAVAPGCRVDGRLTVAMIYLRVSIYPHRIILLSYALPLLIGPLARRSRASVGGGRLLPRSSRRSR